MTAVRLTAVRLVLAIAVVMASSVAAQAQTFWGAILPNARGERLAMQWAYIGDQPGSHYSHVVYAVARSRPEGFWWFMFRNGCIGQDGYSTSWGFVRWDDGTQTTDRLFDLFEPDVEKAFTHVIQCAPPDGMAGPIEGREVILDAMRRWQQQTD